MQVAPKMISSETQTDLVPELMQKKFEQRKANGSFSSSCRRSVLARHLRSSQVSGLGSKQPGDGAARTSFFANIVPVNFVCEDFKEEPEVELSDAPFERSAFHCDNQATEAMQSRVYGMKDLREHSKSLVGCTPSIRILDGVESKHGPLWPVPFEIKNAEHDPPVPFEMKLAPSTITGRHLHGQSDSAVLLASDDSLSSLQDSFGPDSEMAVDLQPNKQEEEYIRMSLLALQILHKDNEQVMAIDATALFKEVRRQRIPFYRWSDWIADVVMRVRLESAYQQQAAPENVGVWGS